jgi:spermidine synthase
MVIQIVAIRAFSILLGNTLFSLSCVVTSFMLGLSLGSFLLDRLSAGRRKALIRNGFLLYGLAELGIGLFAVVALPLLFSQQGSLIAINAALTGQLGQLPGNLLFAFTTLLLPTTLMGATLPLVSHLLPSREDVSKIYAANLLGAALGALIASFWLIAVFGCTGAAWVVLGLNAAICVGSVKIHKRWCKRAALNSEVTRDAATPETPTAESLVTSRSLPTRVLLLLAFFSGFLFLAAEVLWTRQLSQVLGNRVYVTSVTLCVVLLALAAGAGLTRPLLKRWAPLPLILGSYLVALLFIMAGLWLKAPLMRAMVSEELKLTPGPDQLLGEPLVYLTIAMLIPATVLAVAFPTLLTTQPSGKHAKGELLGSLIAINTLGSVLGAVCGSYFLLHYLGTDGSWVMICAILLLIGFVVIWTTRDPALDRMLARALAPAALCFVVTGAHSLSEFRSPFFPAEALATVADDEHGIFQVVKQGKKLRVFNNSTELVFHFGSASTQYVQEMLAHAPLLFVPNPKRVADLGTGYGITAGAFTGYRQLEKIDTVEIVPAMLESARLFKSGNARYYDNPRVGLHVADGRQFLVTASDSYDVISVNVSDPYLPGGASLFSQEFYTLVRSRLNPGGVFCQHIFGSDTASLVHGVAKQFPHVRAAKAYGNGLIVVASTTPLPMPGPKAFQRLAAATSRRDLRSGGFVLQKLAEGERTITTMLQQEAEFVNTDSHPVLEFRRIPGELGLWHSNQ